MSEDDLQTFQIRGLPIPVQARAQEQADELIRELTLIGEQLRHQDNERELPSRLVELIDQLTGQYSMFTVEQEQQLAQAIDSGDDTIDLDYTLPTSVAGACQALSDILDEADDYCRAGQHLLTLATPDDLVNYRRWFLRQFIEQAAGHPPVTWDDYLRQHAG